MPAALSAGTYYWIGPTGSLITNQAAFSQNADGTGTVSDWDTTANNDLLLANSVTANSNVDVGTAALALNSLKNTNTGFTAASQNWNFYNSGASTWSIGSILQDSLGELRLRARSGLSNTIALTVTGNIAVNNGKLSLGNNSSAYDENLKTLTVNGTVHVGSTYTVDEGTATFTKKGEIQIVVSDSAAFEGAVTVDNAAFTIQNNTSANGQSSLSANQTISFKSLSIDNTYSGSVTLGTWAASVPTSTDNAVHRIKNFKAGDLSITNANSTTSINAVNFNVNKDLYTGATGTFFFSNGTNTTDARMRMFSTNIDIDNFVLGEQTLTTVSKIASITRGTDQADQAIGTVNIGNLTVYESISAFRIGYYFSTNNYYTKYESIDIATASIARDAHFVADAITIGSLTKEDFSGSVYVGVNSDSGGFNQRGKTVTLGVAGEEGAASTSVSSIHGGSVFLIADDVKINGTIKFQSHGSQTNSVLYANATNETNIDKVLVSRGDATEANPNGIRTQAYVRMTGDVTIGDVTVESGFTGGTNILYFNNATGTELSAGLLDIGTLNIGNLLTVYFGNTTNRIGDVDIGTVNITGDADRMIQAYLNGLENRVHIGTYALGNGVGRLEGDSNYIIDYMNLNGAGSGAYVISGGASFDIGELNYNSSNATGHRFGADGNRQTVAIGTLNLRNTGTMNLWGSTSAASIEITTANLYATNNLNIYGESAIGALNFYNNAGTTTVTTNSLATVTSILVNNSGGTALLRGSFDVTAGTTIEAGRLIAAAGSGGIGDLFLKGGSVGAAKADAANAGLLYVNDFTWSSGGTVEISFYGTDDGYWDKLLVQGDLLEDAADGGGKLYSILVAFDGEITLDEDADYEIINVTGIAEIAVSDVKVAVEGGAYSAVVVDLGGGVWALNFTAIPEPAHISALLGALALLFATRRKKTARK